jgi:hypothetical protein
LSFVTFRALRDRLVEARVTSTVAMDTLLYPFRYRDALTGRWVRVLYKASIETISARYSTWQLTGPAEIRRPIDAGSALTGN